MPHSLRVRLKNLEYKGKLEKKDVDRIIEALDYMDNVEKHDREFKNEPHERFLPCICGCNQIEHWWCINPKDGNQNILSCKKCGKKASGKSEADAQRNWNEMIRREDSRGLTNTWLQDIAASLAIIADWCIKDNERKNKND